MISKSDYMTYLQCPTLLWHAKNDRSKLPQEDDPSAEARGVPGVLFMGGRRSGTLLRPPDPFPGLLVLRPHAKGLSLDQEGTARLVPRPQLRGHGDRRRAGGGQGIRAGHVRRGCRRAGGGQEGPEGVLLRGHNGHAGVAEDAISAGCMTPRANATNACFRPSQVKLVIGEE